MDFGLAFPQILMFFLHLLDGINVFLQSFEIFWLIIYPLLLNFLLHLLDLLLHFFDSYVILRNKFFCNSYFFREFLTINVGYRLTFRFILNQACSLSQCKFFLLSQSNENSAFIWLFAVLSLMQFPIKLRVSLNLFSGPSLTSYVILSLLKEFTRFIIN